MNALREGLRTLRVLTVPTTPPVLMYHFFGEPPATGDPLRLFVGKDELAAQLDDLRARGWRPLDLDGYLAALAGAPTPRRSFLLTIDDGHESVVDVAAPMLAAAGVPSVLFVCPGLLGDRARWSEHYPDEPLAGVERIGSLPAQGMELGVHGLDHTRLAAVDAEVRRTQTADARALLQTLTGVDARSFAYPFGTHDADARRAVADAGFEVAFAVAREAGRFGRDRVYVRRGDPLLLFRFKLTAGYRILSRTAGRVPRLRHWARTVIGAARAVLPGRPR
ncbi:MAG: polysaccharide deacetylase family protein [Pseudonocardia sp.]|nr:polysaccharide deacetylase family protein [Pseudonocardia sp.]